MSNNSHLHVRPLETGDFDFVRELASKQRTFTIPPPYVLWLLMRIKGAACLIAERPECGQVAYLLAVPVEGPSKSLFVWQLASSKGRTRTPAAIAVLTELRGFASRQRVRAIYFSMRPRSAAYRLISRYAGRLVARSPRLISTLPSVVSRDESEYRLDLPGARVDHFPTPPSSRSAPSIRSTDSTQHN